MLIEGGYSVGEIFEIGLEFFEFDNLTFFWRDGVGLVDEGLKICGIRNEIRSIFSSLLASFCVRVKSLKNLAFISLRYPSISGLNY